MSAQPTFAEQLWSQFAAGVRSFLRSRLPNDAVADDLLQETFLRVHRRQQTLRKEPASKSWVYQIARNLVIDYYRGEGTRHLESLESQPVADVSPDLSAREINQQIGDWLLTTIDHLPDTYREATRLSAVEGLPHQAIAQQLGLSLEAVKSRIRRGREQLKTSLLACCSLEVDPRGHVVDYEPRQAGQCCGDESNDSCS